MTQAFNLSQLANKVNTSGQLDASTGLVNITPVANGGTGKSSNTSGRLLLGAGTSAMTELTGAATNDVVGWNGSAWVSTPASSVGASGDYIMSVYVSPATYVKPASLKALKVTVVGAGGAGGGTSGPPGPGQTSGAGGGGGGGGSAIRYLDAPAVPASPIAITAGAGTNSFGAFASATAGSAGVAGSPNSTNGGGGGGGSGSSGTINIVGTDGTSGAFIATQTGGASGSSALFSGLNIRGGVLNANGNPNSIYGGGGTGSGVKNSPGGLSGGTGAPGIVIIEEFY